MTNIYKQLTALIAALACLCPGLAGAVDITAVRVGLPTPGATRLVVDATGGFEYALSVQSPKADSLTLTLTSVSPARRLQLSGTGLGHIGAYAITPSKGSLDIAIKLKKDAKIKQVFEIPPSGRETRFRLVLDLTDGSAKELLASLPARKFSDIEAVISASTANGSPSSANAAAVKSVPEIIAEAVPPAPPSPPALPVIVIDAGHGGSDPGAKGPGGAEESHLTLAAAKVLAELLEKSGRYKVVLTRDSNVRIAHEERSRIAREAKAELFLSLHADAHVDKDIRGGSVYTLSEAGTERSAREALSKDNYVISDFDLRKADPKVGGILFNLAQRETENASDRFAEILVSKLAGATPLLNNTHRRANFKVLLAPDVPAVLLELAFISNRADETNLKSEAWRRRTMAAVVSAIDAYFADAAPMRHASR